MAPIEKRTNHSEDPNKVSVVLGSWYSPSMSLGPTELTGGAVAVQAERDIASEIVQKARRAVVPVEPLPPLIRRWRP